METAVRVKTTVLPGGRIEFSDTLLNVGDEVEIILLMKSNRLVERESAIDILAKFPGKAVFDNADDVDAHIRGERDAWDQ